MEEKEDFLEETERFENDEAEETAWTVDVPDDWGDDEELEGLSPEEAENVRKQKREEHERVRAAYDEACLQGDAFLQAGSFHAAELKFENALNMMAYTPEANAGYWKAKTENFKNPDVLIGEYAEASIESLEFDLTVEAVDALKKEYQDVFRNRYEELSTEEKELAERVEGKQARRRKIIIERLKRSGLTFGIVFAVFAVALALTIVFGLKQFTPQAEAYLTWLYVCGAVAFVAFVFFIFSTNRLLNDYRMYRANERVTETEEGAKLTQIRDYMAIYKCLLLQDEVQA